MSNIVAGRCYLRRGFTGLDKTLFSVSERGDRVKRYFIITIDTEGDNLWAVSDIKTPVRTENAKYLYRFQMLCEKDRKSVV